MVDDDTPRKPFSFARGASGLYDARNRGSRDGSMSDRDRTAASKGDTVIIMKR